MQYWLQYWQVLALVFIPYQNSQAKQQEAKDKQTDVNLAKDRTEVLNTTTEVSGDVVEHDEVYDTY